MQGFVDETTVVLRSGKGGAGAVSFRREKYVPKGGPDGGDGGRGGNVLFTVRENLKTLSHLRSGQHFIAKNGQSGSGAQKHGANGADAVIEVPPGTVVRNVETGETLADLVAPGSTKVLLQGGQGGKGNTHFKSSRQRSPRFAQPGMPGDEVTVRVELQLIADLGFVGLPNAGKSSLLASLTAAHPQVADYPFTTKTPSLGVIRRYDGDVVLADIPGIIEGAAEGAGLGVRFLKHISRTRVIAFLIDCSQEGIEAVYPALLRELKQYDERLLDRPRLVLGTKMDREESRTGLPRLVSAVQATHPDGDAPMIEGVTIEDDDTLQRIRAVFFGAVLDEREQ